MMKRADEPEGACWSFVLARDDFFSATGCDRPSRCSRLRHPRTVGDKRLRPACSIGLRRLGFSSFLARLPSSYAFRATLKIRAFGLSAVKSVVYFLSCARTSTCREP